MFRLYYNSISKTILKYADVLLDVVRYMKVPTKGKSRLEVIDISYRVLGKTVRNNCIDIWLRFKFLMSVTTQRIIIENVNCGGCKTKGNVEKETLPV